MKTYHVSLIAFLLGTAIALLVSINARLGQLVELGIMDAETKTASLEAEVEEKTAELEELDDEVDAFATGHGDDTQGISASQAQAIADVVTNAMRGRSCPHCGGWVR